MSQDEDSDGSSSLPDGLPGGSTLSFLPVTTKSPRCSAPKQSDNDSDSDDESSSSPIGIPGGANDFEALSFLPITTGTTLTANDNGNDSDSSSTSSTPMGVPGGGDDFETLSFLPTTTTTNAPNAQNDDDSDDSSSSSSSVPQGVPGGGDSFETLSFLPTTTTTTATTTTASAYRGVVGDRDQMTALTEGEGSHSDSDSNSNSAENETVDVPGGGAKVEFVPMAAAPHPNRQRVSQIAASGPRSGQNVVTFAAPKSEGVGHMQMVSYHSEDDDSDAESSSPTPTGVPGGGSDELIFMAPTESKQPENSRMTGSRLPYGLHEVHNRQSHRSVHSAEAQKPKLSVAKTAAPRSSAMSRMDAPRPSLAAAHSAQNEKVSDRLKRRRSREQEQGHWDLVYMTSSPLICRIDFDDKKKRKKKKDKKENDKKMEVLELLDVAKECDLFMGVLNAAERQLVVVHEIATTGNLIKAMAHGVRILHYSGPLRTDLSLSLSTVHTLTVARSLSEIYGHSVYTLSVSLPLCRCVVCICSLHSVYCHDDMV